MAGADERILLTEFNLADLAHELGEDLPPGRNPSEVASHEKGRSSPETVVIEKGRSSSETANKEPRRSSSETANKEPGRSSSETANKEPGRSSSETADKARGRSSTETVHKRKSRSSSKHAKKSKKRKQRSSSETAKKSKRRERSSPEHDQNSSRRNSPENVEKEVDPDHPNDDEIDARALSIPSTPRPSSQLPPVREQDRVSEDSEDDSDQSEDEGKQIPPEDRSFKRAPSSVSVVSSIGGGGDLSGSVMPVFQEDTELPPTLFALSDGNRHLVETYLAGQSLQKEKLTQWRKKIPRPDHIFAQPAELDQMLRVYLTKKLNISTHNKAFELDAAIKDVGQNILNVFNPLFILQAINAERQPSSAEIDSAVRFCFEYLSHAYMRSLFHRRHAFSGLMNLNELGTFKQALESTPLSAESTTSVTRSGSAKLAPSLFGRKLMGHIQEESSSLRPFLKDMKFLVSEGLSKAPRSFPPKTSPGGGTSGRYGQRYEPYRRPSDGQGSSTSRDRTPRTENRPDRSTDGHYGGNAGNSRSDSRGRGGGRSGGFSRGRFRDRR